MNIVYDIGYGTVSSDQREEAIAKRKQILINVIHRYYGEVVIIGAWSNHSGTLINSKKKMDSEVSLNSNKELIIKNAAKCLRNDIRDFCTRLPPLCGHER